MNKLQELTLEVTVRECVGAGPIDPDSYKEDVLEESSIIIGLDDRYKDTVYHNLLGCVEALELEELFLSKIASGVVTIESPLQYRRERLLQMNANDYIEMLFEDIEINKAISESAKEVAVVGPCRDWFELFLDEVYVDSTPPLMDGLGNVHHTNGITLAVIMTYKGGCTLTSEQMYKQIDFIKDNFVAGRYHLKLESPTGNHKLTILIDRESISQFITEAREKAKLEKAE